MRLHSIYLTGRAGLEEPLVSRIEANVRSFREQHPGLPHTLYRDETLREFIRGSIGRDAVQAFDSLIPLAYKADLGRYCLLLHHGGVYADLAAHFFHPVCDPVRLDKVHVFRDGFSAAPWIVSNSIIGSPPGKRVFQLCIEKIIEHCRARHYGFNALCPTGPNLFGWAVATSMQLGEFVAGETMRINRNEFHSYAYLSASGDVIAVSVKKGTGLSSLGTRLHDDYGHYYASGNVYGELARPMRWATADFVRRRWIDAPLLSPAGGSWSLKPGLALRGPGVALGPGLYQGVLHFRSIAPVDGGLRMVIEITCEDGQRVLAESAQIVLDAQRNNANLGMQFRVERVTRDIEVRLRLLDPALVDVRGSSISRPQNRLQPAVP